MSCVEKQCPPLKPAAGVFLLQYAGAHCEAGSNTGEPQGAMFMNWAERQRLGGGARVKDPRRGKSSRQNAENMLCWHGTHHLFENFICFKVWFELAMETQAFNLSTQELELSTF